MVLGMLFENFKNVHILRYIIYEFLKKVSWGPQPTCFIKIHCALSGEWDKAMDKEQEQTHWDKPQQFSNHWDKIIISPEVT